MQSGNGAQGNFTYSVRLASGASRTLSASTPVVPVGTAAAIPQNKGASIAREIGLTILATGCQRFEIAGNSGKMVVDLRTMLVDATEEEDNTPFYRKSITARLVQ